MLKKLYFQEGLERENSFTIFFHTILQMASLPRLLLEVFIRKNFGIRYFRYSHALSMGVSLILFPTVISFFKSPLAPRHEGISPFLTWNIFGLVFLGVSTWHYIQRKRKPNTYDVKQYSKYRGERFWMTYLYRYTKLRFTVRTEECYIEPLGFFILGVLLSLTGQALGYLLVYSSVVYSLSYVAAYKLGDDFVTVTFDKQILSESFEQAFLTGEEINGYRFLGRRPEDEERRKEFLGLITAHDEIMVAR